MNKQKFHPDSGFSLLEVLVAIIAITFFSAAAMQMMVISATFKARAKEYTTAANLIQQDLENIRNQANQIRFPVVVMPTGTTSIAASTRDIRLESVDIFTAGDRVQFTGTPTVYTIVSSTSSNATDATIDTSTKTLTIQGGLQTPVNSVRQNGGTTLLINNSLCSATTASGLAAKLEEKAETNLTTQSFPTFSVTTVAPGREGYDQLPSDYRDYKAVSGFAPHTIPNTGRKLWVMRKDAPVSNGVLEVKYLVVKDRNNLPGSSILGKLSSEVIPDASYQCIKK